jgi:hypothetical protein
MFKQAKKTLEDLSHLDTANYIKMAKKIRDDHENPSENPNFELNCVSSNNSRSTRDLYCALKLNRLF